MSDYAGFQILSIGLDTRAEKFIESCFSSGGTLVTVSNVSQFENQYDTWQDDEFAGVFCSSNIPELSGAELAQSLHNQCPRTNKYFITYDMGKFFQYSANRLRDASNSGIGATERLAKLETQVRGLFNSIFDQSVKTDFAGEKEMVQNCQSIISNFISKGTSNDWYTRLLSSVGEKADTYNHASRVLVCRQKLRKQLLNITKNIMARAFLKALPRIEFLSKHKFYLTQISLIISLLFRPGKNLSPRQRLILKLPRLRVLVWMFCKRSGEFSMKKNPPLNIYFKSARAFRCLCVSFFELLFKNLGSKWLNNIIINSSNFHRQIYIGLTNIWLSGLERP
jgi:hypothetical protein